MKGSIEKRGNSWRLSVYLGKDPVTGKEDDYEKPLEAPRKTRKRSCVTYYIVSTMEPSFSLRR